MSAPHNVALIGYGYAGKTFHAPLIGAADGLALTTVVSRYAAKVHADLPGIRVEPNLAAVLADPSIALVVIATPNDSHAPLAHAAIAAGKAVVVDKPLALTLAEARAIVTHAEERGALISVFHNRRWDGDFLSIRDAIALGAVGKVAHFESHFDRFRPEVRDRWREKPGPGSGVWADLGPHLIDQALTLFGMPARVIASLGALRDGATTDDWAHVVLEYPRLRCVLNAGMLVAGGSPRFIVHGSGGSLIKHGLDPQEAQLVRGIRPGDEGWADDPQPMDFCNVEGASSPVPLQRGDYPQFYAKMAAALDGGDVPVRPQEALSVMAVVEAAALAAATGHAQTVSNFR